MHFDVFNGDADGIFALHQLRLAQPVENATLVTGVKRDINLLKKVSPDSAAQITVLDVSLDKNRKELNNFLLAGCKILYIDHHFAGNIPQSESLICHIEPSPETCTSLIVNDLLDGKYRSWAICGAFGDNLHEQARVLAETLHLNDEQITVLRDIGELFNYNGYGAKIEDLHFNPAELYRAISGYDNPFDFAENTSIVQELQQGYDSDMNLAMGYKSLPVDTQNRIYKFPAESWARRIAGVFSNLKARERTTSAHAIIVENDDTTLQISVRAPLATKKDADTLCRSFPTGGGRSAAAGINHLPATMLDNFIKEFSLIYS